MDSARESILELMNEYCYRIDRGDLQGFADLFSEGTWLVQGDPTGGDTGSAAVMETLKNMTQPEMMRAMNNALNIYQKLDVEDIPEYSIWKAMKEMRSPEMKKGIGFLITFLKSMSNEEKQTSISE